MSGSMHIGTSGYQYDHWEGVLYPPGTAKKNRFREYIKHFKTVEINNTFYNLPSGETFERWRREAPDDFCYALKYSRYGTHIKRLKDPDSHIAAFLERAQYLRENIGPILVQLRPNWKRASRRLEDFLKAAPRQYRWAVEFRDPDWLDEEIYEILRRYNVPLVIHDLIADHPWEVTADWIYLRFHGLNYGGSYSEQELDEVAARIKKHAEEGREVFVYFNNDAEGHAVRNALELQKKSRVR